MPVSCASVAPPRTPGPDAFTVELRRSTGQALPTVLHDGQEWFVGEPGQEFKVAVSMSNRSCKDYKVGLRVDGRQLGYTYVFNGDNITFTHVYPGWLEQTGSSSAALQDRFTYRSFKLGRCKPGQAAATVGSADQLSVGRIEVVIDEVVDTGRRTDTINVQASAHSSTPEQKLSEGKKWFLAPGLKAEAGSMGAPVKIWDFKEYDVVGTLPSVKVRYDSSEALFLRKVLNPRFAPHRAILRGSTNPAVAARGAEPTSNAGPSNAAAAAAAGGSGVKRERDAGDDEDWEEGYGVPRSATAAVDIDLTDEPVVPLTVNGRQLVPDELAVCDLCDSDDEGAAPKWEVRKKQAVEVGDD